MAAPLHALSPLALAALFCVSCTQQPPAALPPPAVTVAKPEQRDVIDYAIVTGTTEAIRIVEVRARVQGILQEISYAEGELVEIGDPMFRIDPAPFTAARDAAMARVTSAEAEERVSETTAQRMERSAQDKAVSELQALEARARAEAAAAEVEVARKEEAIKQLDVDYTDVRAPITGLAARSSYKVGSLVGAIDSAELTTIYDDSKVYAWFTIPDRTFLEARQPEGQTKDVEIEIATENDEGFPHRGVFDYADPSVDQETGTIRVRAVFDNPERLLVGGLFVRGRIALQTLEDALLVPESALGADQVGRYVYTVDSEGKVERRAVELGPREDGLRVILSGVDADDRVIVQGLLRARPGALVQAEDA